MTQMKSISKLARVGSLSVLLSLIAWSVLPSTSSASDSAPQPLRSGHATDTLQNGVSEPAELHLLSEFGIESISLDYKESRHKDRYGNEFRYRAKVYGANHQDLGRWACDVFLQSTK